MENAITISTLPSGNKFYSLNAYTGKNDRRVRMFFNPTNKEYHKILYNACNDKLNTLDDIEKVYYKLVSHAWRVLSKFMFVWNIHNFFAFIQQYKVELENIGITSFLPARDVVASNTFGFEVDPNGIIVRPKIHHDPTHRQSLASRLHRHDIDYTSKYFNDRLVTDVRDINDSTWVVRTVDGHGQVLFFNLIDITNGIDNADEIKLVKAYEVDRLKYTYKLITNIGYFNVRAISFKSWKKLPVERQIGTGVIAIDDEIREAIKKNEILNKLINL